MNISILHHDEHYVAIHKPAGMLVHRSPIDRHETVFALQLTRDAIGQRVYPVHRLDKPTSGVLLFALNPDVANQTMRLFQDQQVEKIYRAIVRGYTEPEGNIDYPLIEKKDRVAEPLATPATQPQPAVTHYLQKAQVELDHPVGRYATARYSYVELRPRHGRRHQLRRHMKHIFHPVVGDTTHGDGRHNQFFRDKFHCHRLLLAAVSLSFRNPISGTQTHICAAPEPSFARMLESLHWLCTDADKSAF